MTNLYMHNGGCSWQHYFHVIPSCKRMKSNNQSSCIGWRVNNSFYVVSMFSYLINPTVNLIYVLSAGLKYPVYENILKGNLKSYLEEIRDGATYESVFMLSTEEGRILFNNTENSADRNECVQKQLLSFASDVAEGLAFLHTQMVWTMTRYCTDMKIFEWVKSE